MLGNGELKLTHQNWIDLTMLFIKWNYTTVDSGQRTVQPHVTWTPIGNLKCFELVRAQVTW